MVKKRIQAIWHAGLEDFAARRAKVQAGRGARAARAGIVADLGREAAARPAPRLPAADSEAGEQLRRAVIDAVGPLREEVAALKAEVATLRARLEEGGDRKPKAPGRKH
jgi:hypothetical protein